MPKQLSISKVTFNEKCLSTLQSEGLEDVLLSLMLFIFPFTLKSRDGMKERRTGARGEEDYKLKCFQRKVFCLTFFVILWKTFAYFKLKRPGNVLSGHMLTLCQAAPMVRDPAWQWQHICSYTHFCSGGRHIPDWFNLQRKGSTGTFTLVTIFHKAPPYLGQQSHFSFMIWEKEDVLSIQDQTPMGIGSFQLHSRQAGTRSEACVKKRMRKIGLKAKRTS